MANTKRRCTNCKKYKPTEQGIIAPIGFFCDQNCRYEYATKKTSNLISRSKKLQSKKLTEDKKKANKARREAKRKDLKHQHKLTQAAFNKMRVLEEKLWFKQRGLEPTCISCGRELGNDQWCCGHFKTRGSQSNLRYDKKNTFLQHNFSCNLNLSGDIAGTKKTRGYKQGLIERFGEVEGQAIIDYCESNTSTIKWTCEELEEMRSQFNERIRKLNGIYNN